MISLQLSKLDSILFVKNGSNNSEKFTSSVKIIVLASSRGLDKKTPPPQMELERGRLPPTWGIFWGRGSNSSSHFPQKMPDYCYRKN